MSQMVGADADALDAAANQLSAAADELDVSARTLSSSLGSLSWLGKVAVGFSDVWQSLHNPNMAHTAGFLRDNADRLHRQAIEQRRASDSDGQSRSSGMAAAVVREAYLRQIADRLAADLQRVRLMSPEQQAAWWNSLTDEQRTALLAIRPGELTALFGLPADVLRQARENFTSSIAGDILTSSTSIHGEVEASIRIFKVGEGFDAEVRNFKNGSIEVEISRFVKGGVGIEDNEILRSAGLGGTFEFASQAEADQFLHDLAYHVARGDALGFLQETASHLGSVEISTGVEGNLGAGGAAVGISGDVSASMDMRGEHAGDVTLSAHGEVSGGMHSTLLDVSGKVGIEATATFVGTTPREMTFSLSYEHATMGGVFADVVDAGVGATHSGTAEVTFDLTQPELRAAAEMATAALRRGDVAGATQALASVMDRAQIVVQESVGAQTSAGFDAKVVKAEIQVNTSTVISTYVKPPGGSFYEVK